MRFSSHLLAIVVVISFSSMPTAHAAKRFVLFEEATQWNCPPCSMMNPLFEAFLKANQASIIGIRYHGWWPGNNDDPMYAHDQSDHQTRINYYGINSEPYYIMDGIKTYGNGYYPPYVTTWQSDMATRLGTATPLTLTVTEAPGAGGTTITVTANSTSALATGYVLQVALVQALVQNVGNGTNGETEWENVVQKMYPDANGSAITLVANQQKTFTFTESAADAIDPTNVFVVAWVQNTSTKEVVNAATDAQTVAVTATSPTLKVAAANATNTFSVTATNVSTVPVDVTVSLDPANTPLNWSDSMVINGQQFTDPQTLTIKAGDSLPVKVTVNMAGGLGINEPTVSIVPSGPHSSTGGAAMTFASISNDLKTVVVDGDGGVDRQYVYETFLSNYNHPSGTLTSDFAASLLNTDKNIKTVFYVAGQNCPTDAEVTQLEAFLTAGGRLLITGEVLGTQFSGNGSNVGLNFYKTYLHTTNYGESGAFRGFTGVADASGIGKGITAGVVTTSTDPTHGMRYWPDRIKPLDASATIFGKYTGVDSGCAVAITGTNFKAVYMAFPIEAMDNDQDNALTQIWAWLNAGVQATVSVISPAAGVQWQQGVSNTISWSASGVTNVSISYSTDNKQTWHVITSSFNAATGSYAWFTPSVPPSNNCYVQIANTADSTVVSVAGPFSIVNTIGVHDNNTLATDFQIDQNYPNPFSSSTLFSFDVPREEHVTLNIYDAKGALVKTVLDETRSAGAQSVQFDASTLPNGSYEYRMITPTGTISRSMTLLKK